MTRPAQHREDGRLTAYGQLVRVWRVLVSLVRQGLIRQVVILSMFVTIVIGLIHRDYDLASLGLLWIIYLEITDPNRPAGLRVRRKR